MLRRFFSWLFGSRRRALREVELELDPPLFIESKKPEGEGFGDLSSILQVESHVKVSVGPDILGLGVTRSLLDDLALREEAQPSLPKAVVGEVIVQSGFPLQSIAERFSAVNWERKAPTLQKELEQVRLQSIAERFSAVNWERKAKATTHEEPVTESKHSVDTFFSNFAW